MRSASSTSPTTLSTMSSFFDADFSLLTFVGETGQGPGRFYGASGIAVRGEEFAVVDQLGKRVQLFRFIAPKSQ